MSLKRVCDFCNINLKSAYGFLIDFSFNEDGKDCCFDCYDKREAERMKALKNLPSSIEAKKPPLGYHFYVEDGLMFPTYLEGAEGKEKIDFMYAHTDSKTSRMQ